MNDTDIEKVFQKQAPKADPKRKAEAMQAAMAAFDASEQTSQTAATSHKNEKKSNLRQGFLAWLRPTVKDQDNRSFDMFIAKQKLWLSGAVTCGLAMVGFIWFQNQSLPTERIPDTPIVLNEPVGSIKKLKSIQGKQADAEQASTLARQTEASKHTVAAVNAKQAEPEVEDIKSVAAISAPVADAAQGTTNKVAKSKMAAPMAAAPALSRMQAVIPPPAELPIHQLPTSNNRDRFESPEENRVKQTSEHPISTFSIDVDTAAYSFVRRQLNHGAFPPKQSVRIEELINYFDYQYPQPKSKGTPFLPSVTVLDSPWTKGNKLVHIGIKGYDIPADQQPDSNLVFLLDVSGSMSSADKLPLVKQSMELLLSTLKPTDWVSIVVYAGAAGAVLEPTQVKDKQKILAAMNRLNAGGSTAGGAGLSLAYQLAEANFKKDAVNRIILATDGDFNVGYTGDDNLKTFVERKRESGIFLSVLGFGQGNYQDALMQTLAQSGNGVASYIDTLSEAQKVLVEEASSTLFPIAKDVKIQIEFNPATVKEYRLIGYETRKLNKEDFNNDKVDAGDIGAGHTVTAIYEITPTGQSSALVDQKRYQAAPKAEDTKASEYGFLKLRYKLPNESKSKLIEKPIQITSDTTSDIQREVNFSVAVAAFGQLLKNSSYIGDFDYDKVIELAQENKGPDEYGYRTEFVQLARKAKIAK